MLVPVCNAVLLLSGLSIIFQDFKARQIYLWLILLFIAASVTRFYSLNGLSSLIQNTIFFIVYFLFMFCVLMIYFFLKNKKITWLINTHIGWGDLLLFMVGVTLSPGLMIYFFTFTFIIGILCWIIYRGKWQTIPLAGLIALCYLCLLGVQSSGWVI